VLLPKDYVRYRLSDAMGMDKADGAGTVLFDLKARTWSPEVLKALEIDPTWLPPTFEGPEVTGRVSPSAAEATGLPAGIPLVAGGGDQAAQAVGVGAVAPGTAALTLGTSGVVFASTAHPAVAPEGRLHAFCHAVPGLWHLMGVMLSAAGCLRWYREALAPGVAFEELTREAEAAPPGSEGLQFLPYLSGERTPHADPLARAAWVGLSLRHGRPHMTRAVLEGVAFGLKDCFTLLTAAGLGATEQVRVSGGGVRSRLWREILASVLETELATVNTTEGAAFGAALLAGVGAGQWPSVAEACSQTIKLTGVERPKAEWIERYRLGYSIYRGLYPALASSFAGMATA
jgi:xylulokinase